MAMVPMVGLVFGFLSPACFCRSHSPRRVLQFPHTISLARWNTFKKKSVLLFEAHRRSGWEKERGEREPMNEKYEVKERQQN